MLRKKDTSNMKKIDIKPIGVSAKYKAIDILNMLTNNQAHKQPDKKNDQRGSQTIEQITDDEIIEKYMASIDDD